MSKIITLVASFLLVTAAAWADVGKEEIKKLIQAGIADDTIVLYVRNHGPVASLSADDLAELKKLGASDKVLAALLTPQAPKAPSSKSPDEPGTYSAPSSSTTLVYDYGYAPYYSSAYYPYYSPYYVYPGFGFRFFVRPRTFVPFNRGFVPFGGRGFVGFGGRGSFVRR